MVDAPKGEEVQIAYRDDSDPLRRTGWTQAPYRMDVSHWHSVPRHIRLPSHLSPIGWRPWVEA